MSGDGKNFQVERPVVQFVQLSSHCFTIKALRVVFTVYLDQGYIITDPHVIVLEIIKDISEIKETKKEIGKETIVIDRVALHQKEVTIHVTKLQEESQNRTVPVLMIYKLKRAKTLHQKILPKLILPNSK